MALVQQWNPSTTSPSNMDSTVNTFSGAATTAGNFLHLAVAVHDDTDTVAVSDPAGNTWQQVASVGDVPTSCRMRHFYVIEAGSIESLTITRGTGVTNCIAFLSEFDDPISGLVDDNGANNVSSATPPPCEVTFTESNVLVIGSAVLGVTSRTLTIVNDTEFATLATLAKGGMEVFNAYGVLDNGTYGPEWSIDLGGHLTGVVTSAFSGTARPTVDAGEDQQVAQGAQDIQLQFTPSDGGGAGAPYTYDVEIVSDTTGGAALSSATIANPLLDLGPLVGQTVVGVKVTDTGAVESLQDTVTISAVGASNTAIPISDAVVTGWETEPSSASTHASVVADFNLGTYTKYVDPAGTVVLEWPLSAFPDELTSFDTVTIKYRPAIFNAASGSVVAVLKEGASTVIATFAADVWTAAELPQLFSHPLSSAQIAAITDPTNLRLRLEGTLTP